MILENPEIFNNCNIPGSTIVLVWILFCILTIPFLSVLQQNHVRFANWKHFTNRQLQYQSK